MKKGLIKEGYIIDNSLLQDMYNKDWKTTRGLISYKLLDLCMEHIRNHETVPGYIDTFELQALGCYGSQHLTDSNNVVISSAEEKLIDQYGELLSDSLSTQIEKICKRVRDDLTYFEGKKVLVEVAFAYDSTMLVLFSTVNG